MNQLATRLADSVASDSFATNLRRKRFALFFQLLALVPRPTRILDVGGTQVFWENMAEDARDSLGKSLFEGLEIVLINLDNDQMTLTQGESGHQMRFVHIQGNACHMPQFSDDEFDIVFSNSVIEHVSTLENQQLMAAEIQRVGKRYFVQTPNRYFPIEPHFLFPLFQFYPRPLQRFLLRNWSIGWYPRVPEREAADRILDEFRLMTRGELLDLFQNAKLYEEKFCGLVKSFVVYQGFDRT